MEPDKAWLEEKISLFRQYSKARLREKAEKANAMVNFARIKEVRFKDKVYSGHCCGIDDFDRSENQITLNIGEEVQNQFYLVFPQKISLKDRTCAIRLTNVTKGTDQSHVIEIQETERSPIYYFDYGSDLKLAVEQYSELLEVRKKYPTVPPVPEQEASASTVSTPTSSLSSLSDSSEKD